MPSSRRLRLVSVLPLSLSLRTLYANWQHLSETWQENAQAMRVLTDLLIGNPSLVQICPRRLLTGHFQTGSDAAAAYSHVPKQQSWRSAMKRSSCDQTEDWPDARESRYDYRSATLATHRGVRLDSIRLQRPRQWPLKSKSRGSTSTQLRVLLYLYADSDL